MGQKSKRQIVQKYTKNMKTKLKNPIVTKCKNSNSNKAKKLLL